MAPGSWLWLCPSFSAVASCSAFPPSPGLFCPARWLLFRSYLDTQAGLMSLKGLAAGEAGGGDGVGRFRQDSRALRIGRTENWPSEG